jgi:hypothetical protein
MGTEAPSEDMPRVKIEQTSEILTRPKNDKTAIEEFE